MKNYFKLKLIKFIALATLGGATLAHANLPNDVYTGYWAMSQKVLGEYLVVDFKKQTGNVVAATIYHFECNDDKSYRQINTTQTRLVPASGGYSVYEQNSPVPTSYLKLFHYTQGKKLFLNQTFTDQLSGMKQVFPDGMVLLYYPTAKLEPTCSTEPRQ